MRTINIKKAVIITGIFLVFVMMVSTLVAQPAERVISRDEYIEMFKNIAINEMHLYNIPASITLAQGMLESGNGNSPLAKYANNHFGIKCHVGWEGPTFIQDDDAKNECFRKYDSASQSYRDHSDFLKNRPRYGNLFTLNTTDYKGWAHGLKAAGYATNPKYPDLLIKLIEDNRLYEFDKMQKIPSEPEKPLAMVRSEKKVKTTHTSSTSSAAISVSKNNIKYTVAKAGDTQAKIADRFEMAEWQIKKYNELEKGAKIKEGTVIYLQPKRNKAKQEFHIVSKDETLWDISQQYGIKVAAIIKKNHLENTSKLKPGTKLYLRKNAPIS